MRAGDVVNHLALTLPHFTDMLCDTKACAVARTAADELSLSTDEPHALTEGKPLVLTSGDGKPIRAPVNVTSFDRSGTVGTIVFADLHDRNWPFHEIDRTDLPQTVTIKGANEAEFTGAFAMAKVVDRFTIEVVMTDSGPVTATGLGIYSPDVGLDESILSGAYRVDRVADATTVIVKNSAPNANVEAVTQSLRGLPRIAGAITLRSAFDSFTEKTGRPFLFVVTTQGRRSSVNRKQQNDVTGTFPTSTHMLQSVIEPVQLLLMQNVANEVAARPASDAASTFLRPLCLSLYGQSFDSGLSVGAQRPLVFVGDEVFDYDGARYGHVFSFEALADLTLCDSVFSPDAGAGAALTSRAWLEVDLDFIPSLPAENEATRLHAITDDVDLTGNPLGDPEI